MVVLTRLAGKHDASHLSCMLPTCVTGQGEHAHHNHTLLNIEGPVGDSQGFMQIWLALGDVFPHWLVAPPDVLVGLNLLPHLGFLGKVKKSDAPEKSEKYDRITCEMVCCSLSSHVVRVGTQLQVSSMILDIKKPTLLARQPQIPGSCRFGSNKINACSDAW